MPKSGVTQHSLTMWNSGCQLITWTILLLSCPACTVIRVLRSRLLRTPNLV